jgi:hypothetical protein
MDSPVHRNRLSLVGPQATSTRDTMEQNLELNRQVFGKLLRFCFVYEWMFTIVSFSFANQYGFSVSQEDKNHCTTYFPIWIVCCCIVYQLNLLMHSLRFYWSEPSRLPHYLRHLSILQRVNRGVKAFFVSTLLCGHLLLFDELSCHQTNPELYYTAAFLLAHSYLIIIICFFILVLATICYPVFLCVIRPLLSTQHGMSSYDIQRLDQKTASEHQIVGETCTICLEEFANDSVVVRLPCNHYFHTECAKSWLTINASCPICRRNCQKPDAVDTVDIQVRV